MRLRLALLAAATLAACDPVMPAPPDPPDPPAPATIAVVRPLPDTVVFEGSPRWVPLEERFRHSAGAPLTYAAQADGEALAVSVSAYDYLVLEPRRLGAATVVVEARAEDGTRAADTLAVAVLPACPPEPAPGARDYFPLEAGRAWRFTGANTSVYPNQTFNDPLDVSVTVTEAVCRAGEWRVTLRLARSGSTYSRTFNLTEENDHTLRFEPAFLHPATFARYGGPTSPDTLEATAFFGPVLVNLCGWSSSSTGARRALFAAGVGPTHAWQQQPVESSTYGQGVRTCRLDLTP